MKKLEFAKVKIVQTNNYLRSMILKICNPFALLFILLLNLSFLTLGQASELSSAPPVKTGSYYHDTEAGTWITRLRTLYVRPDDSSDAISTIPHTGVGVHSTWTGEFDITYMFTKGLGAELILGTCRNTLVGERGLKGTKVGTTWLLPPTLTLQWRIIPSCCIQPYVGLGVNYTFLFRTKCSLPNTKLHLSNSWRPAVQGGLDVFVYKDWLLNFDVKYIWLGTKGRLTGAIAGNVHVDINPWVIGFGFGRKW